MKRAQGLTLVELVVAISISGVLAMTVPPLVFQGAQTLVFLPRAQLSNQTALELLHAMTEGNFSTLTNQTLRGLRFAARQATPSAQPAVWLAEDFRIGYLLPNDLWSPTDNQYVVLWRDGNLIRRSLFPGNACPPSTTTGELLPADSAASIHILPRSGQPIFRYYDQNGTLLVPPGCTNTGTIRRVEIAFVAQTGNGSFDQGDARVEVTTSVAIRFP